MTSSYNTRSVRTTGTSTTTDSSTAVVANQRRHFCFVLTNNPRMIQSAQRMLHSVTLNTSSSEQGRQEYQAQPQVQPQVQHQTRSQRRQLDVSIKQQVPMLTTTTAAAAAPSNMRAYETEIEQDFQTQVQPILQMCLRKTRQPHPINSVLDMSNHVEL